MEPKRIERRDFLATAAAAAAASLPGASQAATAPVASPALLTITGAVGRTNRPAFDASRDILMAKHAVTFDKAYAIDYPTLAGLPAKRINVTLEYDRKRHELAGPLLIDVLAIANAARGDAVTLLMRAVDGYAPTLTLADARRYQYIVALRLDGRPMALGGLGPLWAVYEADRFPDMAARPVDQRFATCPWAMYQIDVKGS